MDNINWEQFMGAKLFAWLGGLALFLGVAFFVKYSFDHDLIPPAVRVALGFVFGAGLVVGGLRIDRRRYRITAQTLIARRHRFALRGHVHVRPGISTTSWT